MGKRTMHQEHVRVGRNLRCLLAFILVAFATINVSSGRAGEEQGDGPLPALVFTQAPARPEPEVGGGVPRFLPPERNLAGARIVSLDFAHGEKKPRVLSPEFASACSPVVSFDGKRIAFAGKRKTNGPWNIWEMDPDGQNKRRIVESSADCLMPAYLPSIYTLDNTTPRDQVVFARAAGGSANEWGPDLAWSLYTCELSGQNLRRITFNLSSELDPTVLPDGRVLFSSWQNYGDRYYPTGLFSLLTVNTDGTDLFPFYGNHELPVLKSEPVVAPSGWIYFIESDGFDQLGGGRIGAVNLRRNLKSHTVVADDAEGFFCSPCPLPSGKLVVSHRSKEKNATYGLCELEPQTGQILRKLFDDPGWHEVEAVALIPRERPKGRSSVVNYEFNTADIYCLNCYISDRPEMKDVASGSLVSLRVIEGIPLRGPALAPVSPEGARPFLGRIYSGTPFGPRRILGEVPLCSDGSFYIKVPAETPLAFQLLDENGMAVVTHRNWMWAMPKEARGCIGCHEDRELTPPNRLPEAMKSPGQDLTLPPEKRRTVDFQHEIAPLIKSRCLQCHTSNHPRLNLSDLEGPAEGAPFPRAYELLVSRPGGEREGLAGRYIKPGSARKSPLLWHLFGRSVGKAGSASADETRAPLMPPGAPLNESERNLFIEWIDLGAQWNNRPRPEDIAKEEAPAKPPEKGK
jgi:hypothetical protein